MQLPDNLFNAVGSGFACIGPESGRFRSYGLKVIPHRNRLIGIGAVETLLIIEFAQVVTVPEMMLQGHRSQQVLVIEMRVRDRLRLKEPPVIMVMNGPFPYQVLAGNAF